MNSESVAVAKRPNAVFALAAELAAAAAEEEELFFFFEPNIPPTTAPAMTMTRMGIPIVSHLEVRFFATIGVM